MPRYSLRVLLLLLTAVVVMPDVATAIPNFARRYRLPCHFCHDGYPKLSVLGEQFKERGFRLADDTTELGEWLRSVPVSGRVTLRQNFEEDGDARTLGLFKLVSAGSLGSRVSYWIDDNYAVDNDNSRRDGVDNAFVRVELLPEELYLRAGRIELDLPFSQTRSPQLFPYAIYFATTGFETDSIGTHQDGIEVGGFLDDITRWSVSVVKGRNSAEQENLSKDAGNFDANIFARLMRRFGERRIGTFLYFGRNSLARSIDDAVVEWQDSLFRVGGDASAYFGQAHAYGTFMYGRNSDAFADIGNPNGTGESSSFVGGFIQLDYMIRDELIVSGRMDLVRGPPPGTIDPAKSFVDFSPGLKLWLHPSVRLAFELGFRNENRPTRGAIHIELVL